MKVLLVEDDVTLRTLYKEIFTHNNFDVLEAGDGEEGVSVTLAQEPDAVVLDLMLPRQGGMRTLKILRSHPETKHLPIIILTALPNPEYQTQTKNLVQGFYHKTEIKPQELVEKVKALLKG
ncbi:MAG TPA: response regulator [Candidatus Saccharimonadales bacterium]|nr:response regulator [Candidatus Saccharimonadales bacterium]